MGPRAYHAWSERRRARESDDAADGADTEAAACSPDAEPRQRRSRARRRKPDDEPT
jgi:hypothetical protein